MGSHRVWFAASSVLLTGTLVWAAVAGSRQEWIDFQERYRQLAATRATRAGAREAAARMKIELRQIYLEKLHRIDRCPSCHLGLEDAAMAGAPQPFRIHPGDHLARHPPDRFGCTICHQGQGRATNAREAHGHVEHWEQPMWRGSLMQAACGRCHSEENLPGAPVLSHGRRLMGDLGCRGCHVINRRGGAVGPELTGVASRDVNGDRQRNADDWEWHFRHFRDPRAVRKDSLMPQFGLSRAEIRALTVAVLSLTDENIHQDYQPAARPEVVRALPETAARGRRLWRFHGCAGCHGREGQGGIKNPNAQGGQVPALHKYAETIVTTREDAKRLLARIESAYRQGAAFDGAGEPWLKPFWEMRRKILRGAVSEKKNRMLPVPPIRMPAWKGALRDEEINDLVAYIFSLFPEDKWGDDWDEGKAEP